MIKCPHCGGTIPEAKDVKIRNLHIDQFLKDTIERYKAGRLQPQFLANRAKILQDAMKDRLMPEDQKAEIITFLKEAIR